MQQMTFTNIGFQARHKQMKRERFLSEMEAVVPWRELCSLIEPHDPSGQRSRPPIGIERMLRIYFLPQEIKIGHGTIVDASILTAPSSTKNKKKGRDPVMHQIKKVKQ